MSKIQIEYLDKTTEILEIPQRAKMKIYKEGVWQDKRLRSMTLVDDQDQPMEKARILFTLE